MKHKKLQLVAISLFVLQACTLIPQKELTTTVNLTCHLIKGENSPLIGAEDFAYSAINNGLIVSSNDRRSLNKVGNLFWIDLSLPQTSQKAVKLLTPNLQLIDPHGVDILEKDGRTFLYVITHENRQKGVHHLQEFEVVTNNNGTLPKLIHIQSILFPEGSSPNDISVLDRQTYISSNDTISSMGLVVQKVDSLLGLQRGKLTYHAGEGIHKKISSGGFGNGVFVEKLNDEYVVWWADTLYNQIQKTRFKYNKTTQNLSKITTKIINLNGSPDNIMKGTDGHIYIAAHYSLADFVEHQDNANHSSPYVIYRLDNDKPTVVYSNKGDQFSAASTAVKIANTLYIGQVYNNGLKACHLPN